MRIRVTVLEGGGHIAEILDKATGVNPLWTPPWPSIEPEEFDHVAHPGYGGGPAESRLLSAIMGHNLCLDFFGGPSPEEEAAGLSRTRRGVDFDLPDRARRVIARHAGAVSDRATGRRATDLASRPDGAHS